MMRRLSQATLRRARYVTPTLARSTVAGLGLNFDTSSHSNEKTRWLGIVPAWALMMVALANREEKSECEEIVYRRSEVEKHKSKESGIWVTFKDGVYDITKFIANHPGGVDKIMLAAGQDIEGFWNVYRQHYNSPLPQELLAEMRIGQLHPDDRVVVNASDADESNPYRKDPVLSPVMRYISRQPINAEAPRFLLTDSWVTPTELWFVRNHHPVPQIEDINDFRVDLVFAADLNNERDRGQEKATDGSSSPLLSLTLQDLKTKFPKTIVTTSIQCGGNRRQEMTQVERTNGANWDVAAISTARFGGVRLRDVLASVGITEESLFHDGRADQQPVIQHVHFVGLDAMEASIPVKKALSRFGDVLLAYEMNDEELTPKHGYPLRAVIPGHAGVRNVKWVTKIRLSSEEAQGPWQRGMAYKGFGPSLRSLEGIDVEAIPSLQEQPVTSAITVPATSSVEAGEPLTVKGYAYSGGGRGIVRVDVSIDGGKTWKTATLTEGKDQPLDRAWAWTLWECDFDIPESMQSQSLRIISKATDAAYNVQPDSIEGVWNLRGINNNAWHRVNVEVVAPAVEDEEDE